MIEIKKVVYHMIPASYRNWASRYVSYAGFAKSSEKYVINFVIYGIILGIVAGFISFFLNLSTVFVLLLSFMTFAFVQAIFSGMLIIISDNRKKSAEEVLPDALQLMAANIRSGLTPDRALLLAARPEFGPLEVEIKKAAKKTLSGEPLEDSLRKMTECINSKLLDRSIKLIIEGIGRGGELATLLEQTSEDIRHTKSLLKEVSSYVLMYIIFIFFAVAIGAPLLYAVSTYLVGTMGEIGSLVHVEKVPVPKEVGTLRISIATTDISSEFLTQYSLLALAITSIFGGLIIGLIKDGSEQAGLKFIPVVALLSIGIFFLIKAAVATLINIPF